MKIDPASLIFLIILFLISPSTIYCQPLVLKPTADIWLSDANVKERNSSSGKAKVFKLKSIQEMAVLRFDLSSIKGLEVRSARMFFYPVKTRQFLKYIRMSSVTQTWKEGNTRQSYGRPDGATYNFADFHTKKAWAWPGSQFCDVAFGSGNSLTNWDKIHFEQGGWVSVKVPVRLIYAMAVGQSDGIALQEGGSTALYNHFIYSSESRGRSPYLLINTGEKLNILPDSPEFTVISDPVHSTTETGAVKITIKPCKNVFFWKVFLNQKPVDRWKIKNPSVNGNTEFYIDGLVPLKKYKIEIQSVSISGHESIKKSFVVKASDRYRIDFFNNAGRHKPLQSPIVKSSNLDVSISPGLVKINPLVDIDKLKNEKFILDKGAVVLSGIKGEYLDFQITLKDLNTELSIRPENLENIVIPEGYKVWYSRDKLGKWQSAYLIPVDLHNGIRPGHDIRIKGKKNQTLYIDLYVKKNVTSGIYRGKLRLEFKSNGKIIKIPLILKIYNFIMPDKFSFWAEMNAYHIPDNVYEYYRLARKNRCIANFWVFRPRLKRKGGKIIVDWTGYDKLAGPLISGEVFKNIPGSRLPVECMYLPFIDSWPTELNKNNYRYPGYWPGKGDSRKYIDDHYLRSNYIGDALSDEYKKSFFSVQRQFFDHFKEKGWDKTQMQFFFGGKNTHRIDYGVNMWWTTDEPYHWQDWLALQFFDRLWNKGKFYNNVLNNFIARADISRPQWQDDILKGIVDKVYYGGFNNAAFIHRCKIIADNTGISIHAYGTAGRCDLKNIKTFLKVLNAWLNGADGFLPWQTIGTSASLDMQEGCEGNALFVPGTRFGLDVVGDLRLKAFRDAEQFIEYLVLLKNQLNLTRPQIRDGIKNFLMLKPGNNDIQNLQIRQIYELKQLILNLLLKNEN